MACHKHHQNYPFEREKSSWRVERGRRSGISSHCFSSSLQTNPHTHHLSPSVTPWVIYKCLIMRLFLQFNTSIHQALWRGSLIWRALSFLVRLEWGLWITKNINISSNTLLIKRMMCTTKTSSAFSGILSDTAINFSLYLTLWNLLPVS